MSCETMGLIVGIVASVFAIIGGIWATISQWNKIKENSKNFHLFLINRFNRFVYGEVKIEIRRDRTKRQILLENNSCQKILSHKIENDAGIVVDKIITFCPRKVINLEISKDAYDEARFGFCVVTKDGRKIIPKIILRNGQWKSNSK